MFADILRRLAAAEPQAPPSPEDCRAALAALMVRVARSDNRYTDVERRQIDRLLAERYGLEASAARAVRLAAEDAEAEAPDTVRFTRIVKEAVPYDERNRVVEALWRVAAADGIDAEERGFLRLVVNLLGVSDQDSGLARQKVERNRWS